MRKKRAVLIVCLVALYVVTLYLLLVQGAQAAPPMCQLTGTIADIYGGVGQPYRISYVGVATQNTSAVIIPGKSACSVYTDNLGNLPAAGSCSAFVQGAVMQVTVGSGQPVQVQVPKQSSVDLSTLILANTDPPSIVSSVSVSSGGDYILNVTNPGLGTVGQAVLGPGNVTGWAGQPIPTGVPTSGGIPYYTAGPTTSGGAGAGWQWSRSGTWTPQFLCWGGPTPTIGGAATQGQWIQFGNMVYVQGSIVWNAVSAPTSLATGAAAFSLPFTPVGYPFGGWGGGCCNNPPAAFPIFISNAGAPIANAAMQMASLSAPPTANVTIPMAQMLWYGGFQASAYGQNCASSFANGGSGFSFATMYRIF